MNSLVQTTLDNAAKKIERLETDNRKLRELLAELSGLEVRGHSLLDRLQFSDKGRALRGKIETALKGI